MSKSNEAKIRSLFVKFSRLNNRQFRVLNELDSYVDQADEFVRISDLRSAVDVVVSELEVAKKTLLKERGLGSV